MAYLHCDMCDWSQDDFWDWRYNPWRFFFCTSLREWGWPRTIKCDRELHPRRRIHSWQLLWRALERMIFRPFSQKYWTYKSWKRAVAKNGGKWPLCPECKRNSLDID